MSHIHHFLRLVGSSYGAKLSHSCIIFLVGLLSNICTGHLLQPNGNFTVKTYDVLHNG